MENLNEILELYNIKNIVVDNSLNIQLKNINTTNFDDVRSAAFYAFGQSKITNENIALIIDGNFLSNAYTVLTEAWFQKTNLLIIAIYDSIYNIETNYLNRCVVSNIKFFNNDFKQFKNKLKKSVKLIGPKLINIVDKKLILNNFIIYDKIINVLDKLLDKNDIVYVYNADKITSQKVKINNIEKSYKYGIISKYVAQNIFNKNKSILVCTSDCLKVDSNIFNSRYINNRFKLIVIDNENLNFENWIRVNNIKYLESTDLKNDIKILYDSNEAMVLVVKDGD